jgi:hypothetical protein
LAKIKIARICAIERSCEGCSDVKKLARLSEIKSRLQRELEQTLGEEGIYLPKLNDSASRVLC